MTPEEIAQLPYRPCVGIMLVNTERKVFTATRADRYQDAWQMPQGGIDPGEDVPTAVLRELEEETSVTPDKARIEALTDEPIPYDLPHELVPQLWKGRYRGQMQHWALVRFLGDDSDIDIATEHPEFSKWRWSDVGDIVPNIVDFKRGVYEQVVAAFAGRI